MAVTNVLRITYASIAQPREARGGTTKYSCGFLIPKDDEATINWFKARIQEAVNAGIKKGKFTAAGVKSPKFNNPFKDGDAYYEEALPEQQAGRECYRGHYFITASSINAPGTVDRFAKPVSPEVFYSGCYCRGDLGFFPYNNESFGVGCALNHIMFVKDGERMDGRSTAESVFSTFAEKEESAGAPWDEITGSEDQLL